MTNYKGFQIHKQPLGARGYDEFLTGKRQGKRPVPKYQYFFISPGELVNPMVDPVFISLSEVKEHINELIELGWL